MRSTLEPWNNGSEVAMQDWLHNQEWSSELLVAAWVTAVILVSILFWGYEHYIKR